jgi:Glycosyltransferase family 87
MISSTGHVRPDGQALGTGLRVVLWIFIFLAATEFTIRGPVRYFQNPSEWNDFSQNYTASKLWLRGKSPANSNNFVALWKEQTWVGLDSADIRTHLAPPLGGLVVMAPVAAFPWAIAKIIWLLILLTSFAATVWVFAALDGSQNEARILIFVAVCLAFAPFHTGIANGNTSILVIGLCALAIKAGKEKRDTTAGLLFGFACSIKPQLGAFLVLYYLVRQQWRLFTMAVGCTAGLNFIAVLNLRLRGSAWIQDYLNNARGFVTSNNIDSFASDNPGRFSLINLQVPFFSLTRNSDSANLWAFVVTGFLVCAWIFFVLRRKHELELLSLGTIATIALLPVYHRFYDAGVLVISLCWCIAEATGPSRIIARSGLVLMIPFLFPGSAFLERMTSHDRMPHALTNSRVWESIIMPHETWALVLLCLLLLFALRANRSASANG